MTDQLQFQGLAGVLAHFDKAGQDAQQAIKVYRSQVKELTGHDPTAPLTPLDVVKIVQRVFFGGAHDTTRGIPSDCGPGSTGGDGDPGGFDAAAGPEAQPEGGFGIDRRGEPPTDVPSGDGTPAA